jgi:hypothetical protein
MNEELIDIYNRVKQILKEYEGPLTARWDLDSKYDLWSEKEVVGKSCFHLRKMNRKLESHIRKGLKIGFDLYRKRGWI